MKENWDDYETNIWEIKIIKGWYMWCVDDSINDDARTRRLVGGKRKKKFFNQNFINYDTNKTSIIIKKIIRFKQMK